jgi:hypothetical protein
MDFFSSVVTSEHLNYDFTLIHDKLDYYEKMIRHRHDIFHCAVNVALGRVHKPEVPIYEIFKEIKMNLMKTPDIVHILKNYKNEIKKIYIIDVAITASLYETKKEKENKYFDLCEEIRTVYNYDVEFRAIVYSTRTNNINEILNENKDIFTQEFPLTWWFSLFKFIDDKIISLEIPQKVFREHKKKLYGKDNNDFDIGRITDSDINEEIMYKLNTENYPYQPNYNEDCEMNLLNFLKGTKLTKFEDKRNDITQYDEAFKYVIKENKNYELGNKPVHHCLIPFYEEFDGLQKEVGDYSEQKMIRYFFDYIKNIDNFFIKEMAEGICALDNDDLFLFNTGEHPKLPRANYLEKFKETVDDRYPKYKLTKTKKAMDYVDVKSNYDLSKKNYSYRQFLMDNGHIKDKKIYTTDRKTIRYKISQLSPQTKETLIKSGNEVYKNRTTFKKKKKKTSPFDCNDIDFFVDYLSEDIDNSYFGNQHTRFYDFCTTTSLLDSKAANELKKLSVDMYSKTLKKLVDKKVFDYSWISHLVYTQLMHFNSLSRNNKNISMFNCGIPNFLVLVCSGYRTRNDEDGKAFMSMIITRKPEIYTKIFGDVIINKLEDNIYLVQTTWRRLSISKITFMRDIHYSTLSTTMSLFFDRGGIYDDYLLDNYCLKTIIGYCPTQQLAEFLMDLRFAYMSSFSTYTNIKKLLKEKFSPPYHNKMVSYVVKKMFTNLPKILNDVLINSKIETILPVFNRGFRLKTTVGGTINIQSMWHDKYNITDINQLLEEVFIYVHTMKEPSNMYHEQIKALNTIISFQNKFDGTNARFKYGMISTMKDYKYFEENCDLIGFSDSIVSTSTNLLEKFFNYSCGSFCTNIYNIKFSF